jgi:hypothetical protein
MTEIIVVPNDEQKMFYITKYVIKPKEKRTNMSII